MTRDAMPKAGDWDNYWSLDDTKRFTQISWSKKRIIQILNPYIHKGKTALDAGCGSGFFSGYFCSQEMEVYSLDYSSQALKIADQKTNGRATLVQSDLLNEGLSAKINTTMDLIFTDGLFEHFNYDEQKKIFNNLKSVLSKGGVIVTVVPNKFSPWEIIRPLYMPGIKEDPFTLKQLINLNISCSMNIRAEGGLNTLPFSVSPDKWLGKYFGMLLYTVAQNKNDD